MGEYFLILFCLEKKKKEGGKKKKKEERNESGGFDLGWSVGLSIQSTVIIIILFVIVYYLLFVCSIPYLCTLYLLVSVLYIFSESNDA